MAAEAYKKWMVVAIIVLMAGAVIFAVTTSERGADRETRVDGKTPARPSGPLVDPDVETEMKKSAEDPGSLAILGDKYFENDMYAQAIQVYEKVLELNPDDVDTHNDLGLAYYYTGKSDMAVKTLKKGTAVMPSYQRIWLSLGYVLLSVGRTDEAGNALQKAVQLDPESTVGMEAQRMLNEYIE